MQIPEISPIDLKEKIDKEQQFILVDVRTPKERKISSIGGIFIPIDKLDKKFQELNPNKEIIVYCHHGGRSAQAVIFLLQSGFKNVKNLNGGIHRWACEVDSTIEKY
jgi:rhodanese-related sulfurtransferase